MKVQRNIWLQTQAIIRLINAIQLVYMFVELRFRRNHYKSLRPHAQNLHLRAIETQVEQYHILRAGMDSQQGLSRAISTGLLNVY